MGYTINGRALSSFGFAPGWINRTHREAFALTGVFDLPKRDGKTHHVWGSELDPYIETSDIVFQPRQFALSLTACAHSKALFYNSVRAINEVLAGTSTLSNELLGSWQVGIKNSNVTALKNGWGELLFTLEEVVLFTLADLPQIPDRTAEVYGIDGYSWNDLGVIISETRDRGAMASASTLSLTDRRDETYLRTASVITIVGTLHAPSLVEFKSRAAFLRAVFGRPGLRTITFADGVHVSAFTTDGLAFREVQLLVSDAYMARFECRLITI